MKKIKIIEDILKKGVGIDFPGASFGIVSPDGVIETGYVGYRQLEPDKIDCDGQEIYDIASLTKVVSTTTLIMKLIEEGHLSLEDELMQILKRFRHRGVKIKHLLTHCSGLPADISRASELRHKTDVLNRIYDMELFYPIATKVVYSDVGFILLGLVAEKIYKKTLDEAAKEIIFEPLNMKDTSFKADKTRTAPTEHRKDTVANGLLNGEVHDEKAYAMDGQAGHAGLFSTAYDLCLFIRSLLEEKSVLNKQTIDSLYDTQIIYDHPEGYQLIRAYGWDKNGAGGILDGVIDKKDIIGHTGFTGCHIVIDRRQKIGLVLLSNAVHPKRTCNHIFEYRKRIAKAIFEQN